MLQECYSRVKRWLKFRPIHPTKTADSPTDIARHPHNPVRKEGMREIGLELGLTLLVLLCPLETVAESLYYQGGSVQLPPDYETEFAAGSAERSRLGTTVSAWGDSFPIATEVWRALLQDSVLTGLRLPFRWQLALVDDHSVNACSLPDGVVIVDRGLAKLLDSNRGLWAALLSHEISHVAHRHWLRRYLFESRLQQRLQNYRAALTRFDGDGRWQMASLGEQMDPPAATLKFARELELEADDEGMMLMARSGFHPDFALAIHHLLGATVGEASSFEAIFSTHPRWITRDRKSQKTYGSALEEFTRRWPDAASSPGGGPPTLVFLGELKLDSRIKTRLTVSFSLHCTNPGQPLTSMLRIYQSSGRIGDQGGAVSYSEPTACSGHDEKRTLTISLPQNEQFDTYKWKGEILILGSENLALARSHLFTIHSGNVEPQSPSPGSMAFKDSRPSF